MPKIDLCIVSTRRPDLLATTLKSFSDQVFSNFEIENVLVNLDPLFGDEDDHARCAELVRTIFPRSVLFEPDRPSFPMAVQRLWSSTRSEFVFHLEDDWVALEDIGEAVLSPFADRQVAQVSFHTKEKKWDVKRNGHFHRRKEYLRILGIKIPTFTTFPIFTTSPCILRGEFGRECAKLMDVSKDPEKQFYYGVNPELERYVSKSKSFVYSPNNTPVIADIGRDWQKLKNVRKVIRDAASYWETGQSDRSST
ncbi:glycosyltransferase family 2 protein [Ensifer sp. MJa1]|uniref:glycosyltransferase family 2 protein n=1 Tax=Ensifer sp. MJa1 TaxID=2919888 RepID=UPI00300B82CC